MASNSFDQIVAEHADAVSEVLNGGELSNHLFDELFEFFTNNGEMPYGVAKARDGDPYEWISSKLKTNIHNRCNTCKHSTLCETLRLKPGQQ